MFTFEESAVAWVLIASDAESLGTARCGVGAVMDGAVAETVAARAVDESRSSLSENVLSKDNLSSMPSRRVSRRVKASGLTESVPTVSGTIVATGGRELASADGAATVTDNGGAEAVAVGGGSCWGSTRGSTASSSSPMKNSCVGKISSGSCDDESRTAVVVVVASAVPAGP